MDNIPKDWKLKLRYGKLQTPYHHFTVIIDGFAEKEIEDFNCPKGFAFMRIKVWAEDYDMAADMACSFAENIGFKVKQSNSIYIYDTEPEQPLQEHPVGYGIGFTPYNE